MKDTRQRLSASSVELHAKCEARWGFKYLEKLPDPGSASTHLGIAVHNELDVYGKTGQEPTHKLALALLPLAPKFGEFVSERRLDFLTPRGRWTGAVDATQAWDEAGLVTTQLHDADIAEITDYKTTSNLKYAKTAEVLATDTQANLYAYEALKSFSPRAVYGQWLYVETKNKTPKTLVSSLAFDTSRVVDFVEGKLDDAADSIYKLYQLRPKATELKKNKAECFSYGQRCPFYDACKPSAVLIKFGTPGTPGEDKMVDFATMLKNKAAGITPPPPPRSAAPMPPPAPSAFVPSAPPPRPVVPRTPLRSELVPTLGPPPAPPVRQSARTDAQIIDDVGASLRAAVSQQTQREANDLAKEHLIAQGKDPSLVDRPIVPSKEVEVGFVNPPNHAPPEAPESPEHAAEMYCPKPNPIDGFDAMDRDQLKAECVKLGLIPPNSRLQAPALRGLLRGGETTKTSAVEVTLGAPNVAYVEGPRFVVEESAEPASELPTFTQQATTDSYALFINCMPITEPFVDLGIMLGAANALVKEQTGCDDYRLVEYGKGAGVLAAAFEHLVKLSGAQSIVVDTRTPEGQIALARLVSGAGFVVRGF